MITLKVDNAEFFKADTVNFLRKVAISIEDGQVEGPGWDISGQEECETCRGTGEVSYSEPVYPGEAHMADTGSRPCPDCKLSEEIENDDD